MTCDQDNCFEMCVFLRTTTRAAVWFITGEVLNELAEEKDRADEKGAYHKIGVTLKSAE
jgi:hypothetical protein